MVGWTVLEQDCWAASAWAAVAPGGTEHGAAKSGAVQAAPVSQSAEPKRHAENKERRIGHSFRKWLASL
jgi:hypothetical protein